MSKMDKKFREVITDSSNRVKKSDFETITFRPSPKVAAMMEAYLKITDEPASTAFTDFISEQLAIECVENLALSECIIESFKQFYSEGHRTPTKSSALKILIDKSLVTIEHKNRTQEKATAALDKILFAGKQ